MKENAKLIEYQKHLKAIAGEVELIPGIYNYCDRWCERCPLSARCSVYLMEQKELSAMSDSVEDTMERVSSIFTLTMEMLQEMIEELGVDIEEIPDVNIPEHRPGALEKLANTYDKEIQKWIIDNSEFFEIEINKYLSFDHKKAELVSDVLQVLNWYAPLLGAKLHRAMSGNEDNSDDEIEKYDQLGSAKVALIAIDRSMGAMSFILNNFQEKESQALAFLSKLAKIKRIILQEFPSAMSFIRPGFDE